MLLDLLIFMIILSTILAVNGVIIAAEKKFKSSLTDPQSSFRVEQISRYCGVVYSGLTPDFR